LSYADFLSEYDFNTYIYAPKNDRLLRTQWHQPFTQSHLDHLTNLAQHYHEKQLDFGIGLSPFELYRDFSSKKQAALTSKLEQINAIRPSILCILFDDMQGSMNDLARQQSIITDFIIEHSNASQFVFCPTYYSDDEKLLTHFGAMPDNYLQDLGAMLDPAIEIFWTGPKVFSKEYPEAHLRDVAEKFQRKPLIWDNYPVNDAQRLCDYLHLAPFPDYSDTLHELCSGHLANPMNQAWLSSLSLYTLAQQSLGKPENATLKAACAALCSTGLATQLLKDAELFQQQGLGKLDAGKKQRLKNRYAKFGSEPMAQEVSEWLDGRFAFDPSCLT
jgi:hyaluronoglucosaminidase